MAEKKDPYAHRAHRQKYKLGYGAEGAARGKVHLGGDAGKDPRAESDAKADAPAPKAAEEQQDQE